jgi:hypothetical protein
LIEKNATGLEEQGSDKYAFITIIIIIFLIKIYNQLFASSTE